MSDLEEALKKGFTVTGEVGPVKGTSTESLIKKTLAIKDYVSAVNVTDNQTAVMRLSSLASCLVIQREGIETVLQMTCRDRNRIAMQSDLLGAWALGIRNVLAISGDHQYLGDHPQAKGVYDIDSIQEIAMIRRMNEGYDLIGNELKGKTDYFIGCAANPFADPFEFRALRLQKKVNAGAQFVQTQCVFDADLFEKWMEEVRARGLDKKVHILAGITPLKSARMANYMATNVAGIKMPKQLIERVEKSDDQKKTGVEVAKELIGEVKNIKGVDGIHIMAVGWERIIPSLFD